jgi:hypothetical protein
MLGSANKGETNADRNRAGKRNLLVISVLHNQDEKKERGRGMGRGKPSDYPANFGSRQRIPGYISLTSGDTISFDGPKLVEFVTLC